MWRKIRDIILRLFGHRPMSESPVNESYVYSMRYRDTGFNITAIISNKLATLITTESNVDVNDGQDSEEIRVRYLDDLIQKVWDKSHKITAQALGLGGVAIVPYCVDNVLYFSLVPQNRFEINSFIGDKVTSCTFISDKVFRDEDCYTRYTDYSLVSGGVLIRNKATKNIDTMIELSDVPEWSNIVPEIFIPNCNRLPFAYLKCHIDNRESNDIKGVPITYGCDDIIAEIHDCLEQIRVEYDKKRPKIFADTTLFDKDKKVDEELYVTYASSGLEDGNLIKIFDPAIRDSSYYRRLENLYEILEKSIGTSKGVLTNPSTNYATATEIRQANFDTFALVKSMHRRWEVVLDDLLYAFNVLIDFYNLAPPALHELKMKYDWAYTLIESSTESFQQISEGHANGVISDAEYRQFLKPNETLGEAEESVKKIKESQPKLTDMFGDNDDTETNAE